MMPLDVRRIGSFVAILLVVLYTAGAATDPSSENLEETVCGWFAERAAFRAWSLAAGQPNPNAWRSVLGALPVSHKTRDGRILTGYKISARSSASGPRRGVVLVSQGNAMLADQLLQDLSTFADHGVDVFVYDYRGYGNSEGNRRLKAIVNDYREIFTTLSTTQNEHRLLYGISFGGIVLLNVIGSGGKFDKAVIDSTPSHISHMGCPEQYDPVRNLPSDGSRLMLISGNKDRVVKPAEMSDLISTAKSRGARIVVSDEFDHPFMDREVSVHQQRLKTVKDFLLMGQ